MVGERRYGGLVGESLVFNLFHFMNALTVYHKRYTAQGLVFRYNLVLLLAVAILVLVKLSKLIHVYIILSVKMY